MAKLNTRYCIRFCCAAATRQAPLELGITCDGRTFPRDGDGVGHGRRRGALRPAPDCLSIEFTARRCQSRPYRRMKGRQRRRAPRSLTPRPTAVIVIVITPNAAESMATSAVNSRSFPRLAWREDAGRSVVTVDWVDKRTSRIDVTGRYWLTMT